MPARRRGRAKFAGALAHSFSGSPSAGWKDSGPACAWARARSSCCCNCSDVWAKSWARTSCSPPSGPGWWSRSPVCGSTSPRFARRWVSLKTGTTARNGFRTFPCAAIGSMARFFANRSACRPGSAADGGSARTVFRQAAGAPHPAGRPRRRHGARAGITRHVPAGHPRRHRRYREDPCRHPCGRMPRRTHGHAAGFHRPFIAGLAGPFGEHGGPRARRTGGHPRHDAGDPAAPGGPRRAPADRQLRAHARRAGASCHRTARRPARLAHSGNQPGGDSHRGRTRRTVCRRSRCPARSVPIWPKPWRRRR